MTAKWTKAEYGKWLPNLPKDDLCLYYYEYIISCGYAGEANNLVLNYKISPSKLRENPKRQKYKDGAIATFAHLLAEEIKLIKFKNIPLCMQPYNVALVPIPPSHCVTSQNYDDRNIKVCNQVAGQTGIDVCCDIETTCSIGASHLGGSRSVDQISQSMTRVASECEGKECILLIDDTLTTGAHYAAAKRLLKSTSHTQHTFIGLFLARAVYQNS